MRTILVNDVIGEGKFNKFFLRTFLICFFVIFFDGLEGGLFGISIPMLQAELKLPSYQIGILASYGMFGMVCGSVVCGVIADKIGRKKVIMIATAMYCIFTGLQGFSYSYWEIGVCRFLAGIGLAGVVPNTAAMLSEYSPVANRATLITLCTLGVAIGGTLGVGLGLLLLPEYSWRILFYLSFIPLLLVVIQHFWLPESMAIYHKKNKKEKIVEILQQANPSFVPSPEDNYQLQAEAKKASFKTLFQKGYARNTSLFFSMFFLNLFVIYGLQTWLPKLMNVSGFTLKFSLIFVLMFNAGSLLGVPLGGWLIDKCKTYKSIIIIYFIICSFCTALLGAGLNPVTIAIVIFFAGAALQGFQGMLGAYVVQCYPMTVRSSALGSIMSFGRLGAVAAPTVFGVLLGMGSFPVAANFLIFAAIPLINIPILLATRDYTPYSKENKKANSVSA